MIDVKTAVRRAVEYIQGLEGLVPDKGIRLEETEYDEKKNEWFITLSALQEPDVSAGLLVTLTAGKRTYKIFRINGLTGNVKAMKVRQLQPIE